MEIEISQRNKDLIQKYVCSLFKDSTLEFYGIKTARVKEVINVELPKVEVSGNSADYIFLLEDNSYLHFEFQSTYNKSDLARFALYDLALFQRDNRNIKTVVIYSANVNEAADCLDIGSLVYTTDKIMMCNYDGVAIFAELQDKIARGIDLSDVDMLNLIFLPLMKSTMPKNDVAVKLIELAQTIEDKNKRNTCIASVFAFASRYLDKTDIEKIKEAIKMTDLATLLVEDAVRDAIKDEKLDIAKNMLKDKVQIELIAKYTELDIDTLRKLKDENKNN